MCYLYVTLLSIIVFIVIFLLLSAEMYLMMSRSLARVYPGGREKMPCVLVSMHSLLALNSYGQLHIVPLHVGKDIRKHHIHIQYRLYMTYHLVRLPL